MSCKFAYYVIICKYCLKIHFRQMQFSTSNPVWKSVPSPCNQTFYSISELNKETSWSKMSIGVIPLVKLHIDHVLASHWYYFLHSKLHRSWWPWDSFIFNSTIHLYSHMSVTFLQFRNSLLLKFPFTSWIQHLLGLFAPLIFCTNVWLDSFFPKHSLHMHQPIIFDFTKCKMSSPPTSIWSAVFDLYKNQFCMRKKYRYLEYI